MRYACQAYGIPLGRFCQPEISTSAAPGRESFGFRRGDAPPTNRWNQPTPSPGNDGMRTPFSSSAGRKSSLTRIGFPA